MNCSSCKYSGQFDHHENSGGAVKRKFSTRLKHQNMRRFVLFRRLRCSSAKAIWPVIFAVILSNAFFVHGWPLESQLENTSSTTPTSQDDFGKESPSWSSNLQNATSASTDQQNSTFLASLIRLFKRQANSPIARARVDDEDGRTAKAAFLAAGPVPDQFLHHAIVTSTQRSFGLRLQKATERTTTQPTTPRRTRPPPLYPDRNSIREFHPPSTVSGEGVGSVQVIRAYGNPQSSRSSSLPSLATTASYLPTLLSSLITLLVLIRT